MRRRLLTQLAHLIVGAVISIAVACGIKWWHHTTIAYDRSARAEGVAPTAQHPAWNDLAQPHWPRESSHRVERFAPGIHTVTMFATFDAIEDGSSQGRVRSDQNVGSVYVVECGWPLPCVVYRHWHERGQMEFAPVPIENRGLTIGSIDAPDHVKWLGLGVNTVVYALLAAALAVLWGRGIRLVRTGRLQSPAGGQDGHEPRRRAGGDEVAT